MTRLARLLGIAAIAIAGAAYLAFSHLLTITEHPSTLMLVLGITPLLSMTLLATWPTPMRWWTIALLTALLLIALLYLDALRNHVNWLYFVQHAGAMSLLAITFGSTLGRGDADALCSRVTRLMLTEQADPAYMQFTWRVTFVWAVFFVVSALVSMILFFFGPIVIWSYFANLLTPVMVGLLFVVEYLVRVRVLPNRTHFSIAQIIQAYRSYEPH